MWRHTMFYMIPNSNNYQYADIDNYSIPNTNQYDGGDMIKIEQYNPINDMSIFEIIRKIFCY